MLCVIVFYVVVFWVLSIRSNHIFAGDPRHYVPIYPLILIVLVDVMRRISWPAWVVGLLLVCYGVSGLAALRETRSGILYNSPSYKTLTPALSAKLQSLPADTLLHTQDVGYIAYYAPERPVRLFHIWDAWDQGLACTDLIYPDGFTHAVFLTIDSPLVYDLSLDEITAQWNEWASPCGTPSPVEQIGIARLMQLTLP